MRKSIYLFLASFFLPIGFGWSLPLAFAIGMGAAVVGAL